MSTLHRPVLEPAQTPAAATAAPIRWRSQAAPESPWARPGLATAMLRGAFASCPCCGKGKLFDGWLRQVPVCTVCRAPVGAARADDAPPYFVIFIVAHLVIGLQVMTDVALDLSLIVEAAVFLPLTLALCLGLLRPVKGATIGLMMQLGMVAQPVMEP